MPKHALLSPSSAHRWMVCPASVGFTKEMPNTTSAYAEEGTRAHKLCELYVKNRFNQCSSDELTELEHLWIEAEDEMQDAAKVYADAIERRCVSDGYTLKTEVSLDISPITGEAGAHGTADCLIINGDTMWVVDFKYGRGVPVYAEENPQLTLYALAAYQALDPLTLFGLKTIKLLIVQPRIGNISEWEFDASEVESRTESIRRLAHKASECADKYTADDFHPDEHACRFCLGKGTCPALREQVKAAVLAEFSTPIEEDTLPTSIPVPTDNEGIGKAMHWLPLIKQWTEAIEATAYARLSSGHEVPGYKLVAGRLGARKWANQTEAEAVLRKSLKISNCYEKKLISPTIAAKLAKSGEIAASRWEQLESLIVRSESKPVIAPESDPREALPIVVETFEAVTDETK